MTDQLNPPDEALDNEVFEKSGEVSAPVEPAAVEQLSAEEQAALDGEQKLLDQATMHFQVQHLTSRLTLLARENARLKKQLEA